MYLLAGWPYCELRTTRQRSALFSRFSCGVCQDILPAVAPHFGYVLFSLLPRLVLHNAIGPSVRNYTNGFGCSRPKRPLHVRTECFVLVFFLFSIPFTIFALLVRCSILVVTQIRGRMVGSSLPSPPYGTCLEFFSRVEGFNTCSPRRFASNCAYPRYSRRFRRQQLVSFEKQKLHR